ncbi:MAG: flagellar filament capping protein FliD [Terracidiphilus sp.]
MGTVGLSFGSPTSGTGFDVSSTVAEIVSNLQNVETPWKNQLSTLESQDTAISSLGTLYSNLSNDMSSLTDFSGVLADKEGSSSDESVLELMSASTSAVAGTYAVTVGSLASTANGYLDAVTNSSDTLSGSLAVTANGTAYTFEIGSGTSSGDTYYTGSGNDTLAELASAINSASIGVTASVTTDADGSRLSLVSNTSGAKGSLSATSSITDSTTSTSLAYNSNLAAGANASLAVNGVSYSVASNSVSNVIPGVTFQLLGTTASGAEVDVVIANDNSGVASTVNQFVSDYNSLVSAINTQEGNDSSGNPEPLFGSPTLSLLQEQLLDGLNAETPNGYLDSISSTANTTLSGSMTIAVGSGSAYTFDIGEGTSSGDTDYTGSGNDTLANLASTINSAGMGVTAAVVTSNGQSTLTLTSGTAGSSGALTVTSAIAASTPTAVTYSDTGGYTSTTADSGTLGAVASSSDTLSGSVTIQVGSGTAQTITLNSSNNTLSGLMSAINGLTGVSAALDKAGTGLTLTSGTDGSTGALTVTSTIVDTSSPTTASLSYNTASDINNLTSLGISVNNDGSLTFDSDSLDSVLNSDFSGVVGFFQNTVGWGQAFSNMLTNAGTSSSTGILKLAENSNSTIESTLNAEISKEQTYISAQQSSLTTELNQANEILEELPTELNGMNELYSAITGYNENSNG